MSRWRIAVLLLFAVAVPARAHFIWIVPEKGPTDPNALVIFSDNLRPDPNVPVTKVAATELFEVRVGAKPAQLKMDQGKDAYRVEGLGKGPAVIGGLCRYGVVQKGKAEPFLLVYCARALIGATLKESPDAVWKAAGRLPLEIVFIEGKPKARVLWQGKPLAGAEVEVRAPGAEAVESKTGADGTVKLAAPKESGVYGIRARHVVAQAGEQGGKKYKEVRYYSTLTFPVSVGGEGGGKAGAAAPKADPAATKLLRDARAARVNWKDFPGFTADLEYNHNGQRMRGVVAVSAEGKVKLELPDPEARVWALRQLRSIVEHRLDNSAERNTPCAFLDDNPHHPLGRAVRVLNDELHSSYRIRDRQIIEVNRQMKDARFTITVLHNYQTTQKQFLPASYVVNTWGAGDRLVSSMAFHQTWHRLGAFYLPETVLVVTASGAPGKASSDAAKAPRTLEARSLRLSNHALTR